MSRHSTKCNKISLNEADLMHQQKGYYFSVLDEATEILLGIMKKEVLHIVWGDGPGKPEWRRDIASRLQTVYYKAADSFIECGVGLVPPSDLGDLAKAMVVAYGAGSAAGNAPITAGPSGRLVWDGNLDDRRESTVQTEYLLPDAFNQRGNFFIENSMKLMNKHFQDVLESASKSLPESMFYSNVVVKSR